MTDTPPPGAADPASVLIDASVLKPQLTALVRWVLQGLGVWLVAHGMAQSRADGLVDVLPGLVMSAGALAWSWWQKHLAAQRVRAAAKADPAKVVLR